MTIRTRHLIILLDRLGNKTADDVYYCLQLIANFSIIYRLDRQHTFVASKKSYGYRTVHIYTRVINISAPLSGWCQVKASVPHAHLHGSYRGK